LLIEFAEQPLALIGQYLSLLCPIGQWCLEQSPRYSGNRAPDDTAKGQFWLRGHDDLGAICGETDYSNFISVNHFIGFLAVGSGSER
jgi:hypothetical protein